MALKNKKQRKTHVNTDYEIGVLKWAVGNNLQTLLAEVPAAFNDTSLSFVFFLTVYKPHDLRESHSWFFAQYSR